MTMKRLLGARVRAHVGAAPLLALCAVVGIVLFAATPARPAALFQNPDERGSSELDPDSWTIQGILDDGIDGDTGEDPFKLDDANMQRETRRKARLGLKAVGGQRTTMLLGGDDWLGAPLAVPEDVREHGEQKVGEEVTYWNTHSGQIGTGGGATYPYYARGRRGQALLIRPAQTQILKRLSAEEANAAMDDMFDEVATNEEISRYAERGIDISGAAAAHRAGKEEVIENW